MKKKDEKQDEKDEKKGKLEKALDKSPINYFSDLFIVSMVVAWIVVLIIMVGMAIYATVVLYDIYLWSDISNLVSIPLSCGGAIWMIKNSVQHAIANNQGKQVKMDFPKVNADGEDDGLEQRTEVPVSEEPVNEEPVNEEPVNEEPVGEEQTNEDSDGESAGEVLG